MSAPIALVVFDFDGTLIDSTAAITHSIRRAAGDLGLPIPSVRQASHVIGLGLQDAFRLAVPQLRSEQIPEFLQRYRHHWLGLDAQIQPFEGVTELLRDLRSESVAVAIATGKSRMGLNRALEQLQWRPYFDASRCADEGNPKPHPWMLQDLCEELAVDAACGVMIGDTTHDLGMARSAGMPAVGVTFGAHPADELRAFGAQALVDDIAGLREWLWPRLRRSE